MVYTGKPTRLYTSKSLYDNELERESNKLFITSKYFVTFSAIFFIFPTLITSLSPKNTLDITTIHSHRKRIPEQI